MIKNIRRYLKRLTFKQKVGDKVIINPDIMMLKVQTTNEPGNLLKIMKALHKYNVDITNLETDYYEEDRDKFYTKIYFRFLEDRKTF